MLLEFNLSLLSDCTELISGLYCILNDLIGHPAVLNLFKRNNNDVEFRTIN